MKKLEKNNKATRVHAGWRVALSGGNSNNGSQAGLTARNANNSSSNRNSNIGSHAYDTPSLCALALAKTQIEKYAEHIPFQTTILKINRYYTLS